MKEPATTLELEAAPSATGKEDLIVIDGLRIERGQGDDAFVVEVPALRIERGSFTSILGPSGCGKTSLLFVLGLLRVSGEEHEFRISCNEMSFHLDEPLPGTDAVDFTIFRRFYESRGGDRLSPEGVETLRQKLIGFCLQGGELVPSLNLEENVAVPAHLGGFLEARVRAGERLEALAMEERLFANLPGQLSGGQNQRGVLARALVHDPPLILLDEPTSALDRHTAEKAIQLLQRRARACGQTVIMVTHDDTLAREFSDYIVRMDSPREGQGAVVSVESTGATAAPDVVAAELDGGQSPAEQSWTSRLGYYLRLAWLDAVGPLAIAAGQLLRGRLRGPGGDELPLRKRATYAFAGQLVKNSLIAVAIGLLILLLRGVSAGMVEEFRQSLLKSPTARELTITPMGAIGALDSTVLAELERQHPQIELILPQATHIVTLTESAAEGSSLTLVGTLPEDPKLAALYPDQDFSTFDSSSVVISSALAKELNLGVGDEIAMWVSRALDADGKRRETLPANVQVTHVIDGGDKKTAYAHLEMMNQIADYKAGRPVPAHGWPGFANAIAPRYEAFLLFAKRPFSGREELALASRGLVFEPLPTDDPRTTLYGRLKTAAEIAAAGQPKLHVYIVQSGRQEGDLKWLDASLADQVADLMIDSDAVLLLWIEPRIGRIEGREFQLVGLSGSARWLRSYLRHRRAIFPLNEDGWQLAFGNRTETTRPNFLEAELGANSLELPVRVHGEKPPPRAAAGSSSEVGPATNAAATVDPATNAAAAVDPATNAAAAVDPPATAASDPTANPAATVGPPATAAKDPTTPNSTPATTAAPPSQAAKGADPTAASENPTASTVPAATGPSASAGAGPAVAIVPAALLAHLYMADEGLAVADIDQQLFRPVAEEAVYYQARVFVDDVFKVAELHERLAVNFGVRSNQARVREVQRYSHVLDLLVAILSVMALGIALATVYVVFHDVTLRKKRMIGTLRILGLARSGVLVMLLVRGLLVAAVASALIYAFGQLTAIGLNAYSGQTICLISTEDYLLVTAGIVTVCLLAVLVPAWKVSRLDPVVALEEAKLNA